MTMQTREEEGRGKTHVVRSRAALKLAVFGFTAFKLTPYAMSGFWPLTAWQQGYDVSIATVLLSLLLPVACVVVALSKVEMHPDRIVYLGIGGYREIPLRSIARAYDGESSWMHYVIIEPRAKRGLLLASFEFTKADIDRVLAFASERRNGEPDPVDMEKPESQARKDGFMTHFTFGRQIAVWLAITVVLVLVMSR